MLKLLALLWLLILAVIGFVLFFVGINSTSVNPRMSEDTAYPLAMDVTVVEMLNVDGRFTTLLKALSVTGLDQTLRGEGPFTIFAPTDDAFNALPAGTLESLLEDVPTLSNILLYHVAMGDFFASDLSTMDGTELAMLSGNLVIVRVEDGRVFINQAKIITTDIYASNGVIHVIDAVLIPSE